MRNWELELGKWSDEDRLDPKDAKNYMFVCGWYFRWLRGKGGEVGRESGRVFYREVLEKKGSEAWQLKGWREGLRWFFDRQGDRLMLGGGEGSVYVGEEIEGWKRDMVTVLRRGQYSYRTEQTYLDWMDRFVGFLGGRDPWEAGDVEMRAFLDHMAVEGKVSNATQRLILNALMFWAREVQEREVGDVSAYTRAKVNRREPAVLTKGEVEMLMNELDGVPRLMALVMYGGGLRISELLRLRVKDVDVERKEVTVRFGKGGKDRLTHLASACVAELEGHLKKVEKLWVKDRENELAGVYLPEALARKMRKAGETLEWQWVFPSRELSVDPWSGLKRRHHLAESGFRKHFAKGVRSSGITKRVTPHTLRHSFATHMLENGVAIDRVQQLLGHDNIETTSIYLHTMDLKNEKSPADLLKLG